MSCRRPYVISSCTSLLQAAALSLSQSLAAELCRGPKVSVGPAGSEASTPASESIRLGARSPRASAALVTQVTEMGFSRKSVEYTIKVLGKLCTASP